MNKDENYQSFQKKMNINLNNFLLIIASGGMKGALFTYINV